MKKGEPLIKGKEALADAYADSRSNDPLDRWEALHNGYLQGHEDAEKDLALTIKDIELLHTFLYAIKNNKQGYFTFTRLSDEQYEEVLRRFREMKRQIPKEEEK